MRQALCLPLYIRTQTHVLRRAASALAPPPKGESRDRPTDKCRLRRDFELSRKVLAQRLAANDEGCGRRTHEHGAQRIADAELQR